MSAPRLRALAFGLATLAGLAPTSPRAAGPHGDPRDSWPEYQVIIWQSQTEANYAALRRAGVTAGVVIASRNDAAPVPPGPRVAPMLAAGLRWYVENIATDFYAPYHRWTAGKSVNWLFDEARRRYRADPADPTALAREPNLSDPEWLGRIRARIDRVVRAHAPYRPLFYDLADEAGIGDLAAAVDFDFTPASLAEFRDWLRHVYPDLAALNAEWDSHFAAWSEVRPATTDEALHALWQSHAASLAAWSDFKAWMDVSFARAVRAGTDAVHAADPTALAGLSGAQIPGWGGYDYARLPSAVDVMEIYDAAANIDLVHGLFPDLVLLTSVGQGEASAHGVWRAALQGARGVVLWDERHTLPDGSEWRGVLAAAQALRGPLGARLLAAAPHRDRVAVLYSPASFRIRWLLDRAAEPGDWTTRSANLEFTDEGPVRAAFHRVVDALAHRGLAPRFLTPSTLANGGLDGIDVLVLPQAIALGGAELAAIRGFVAAGGKVVADATPGLFDTHGKQRATPPLADLVPANADAPSRLLSLARGTVHVEGTSVVTRVYDEPDGGRLVALQRDPGAPGEPVVTLTLPAPAAVTDIGSGTSLGQVARLMLRLDPARPTILSVR